MTFLLSQGECAATILVLQGTPPDIPLQISPTLPKLCVDIPAWVAEGKEKWVHRGIGVIAPLGTYFSIMSV